VSVRRRIVLADDHPIVLAGLRSLIEKEDDLTVVGTASTGTEALKLLQELTPDMAIIDISMPSLTGVGLLNRIEQLGLQIPILIYSLHEDRAHVSQALQAGARGYMLKRTASDTAIAAIRAVLAGGIYIDPAIAAHALGARPALTRHPTSEPRTLELTEREESVLKLAAQGFSNKEIAARFDISIKSIETYKSRGMEKLGLRSRVELVRHALARGWLSDM
jgi:DNA-binding NarL/FixJ family response regulator